MITPKKGQIVNFVQVYENPEDNSSKPMIKCYSQKSAIQRNYLKAEKEGAVGYGKLSITADNIVHLYTGKINLEHLNKYKESRKNNLLKLMVH